VTKLKKKTAVSPAPRARSTNSRQRQLLIEACISALHLFGPSRTTVEKVVAIAKMSPGIVRFYFDSKAAMLVASLDFLAAEFEERVLVPVARLERRPVAALELLVDLYLDPDIASPRKVSVWYAFWGEASSRQEYYDICGQKDERFAALVRTLIEALIIDTRQSQLDPDGIALGLIGVLEILWQGFAFQTEVTIDRAAAKHRCMAYLRSIFPGEFAPGRSRGEPVDGGGDPGRPLPRWSFDDAGLLSQEKRELFDGTWQLVGHRGQLAAAGDFLSAEIGTERVLVVRDREGLVRAFRDSCPLAPHRLSAADHGRFPAGIDCRIHGLRFAWDGSAEPAVAGVSLAGMDMQILRDLLFVRASGTVPPVALRAAWFGDAIAGAAQMLAMPFETEVQADWKILVAQWLSLAWSQPIDGAAMESWLDAELLLPESGSSQPIAWRAVLRADAGWTAARYAACARALVRDGEYPWRRWFLPPNQCVELRPDGLSLRQVLPSAPGRSKIRGYELSFCADRAGARVLRYLAGRLGPWLGRELAAQAESIQQNVVAFGYEPTHRSGAIGAELAFRDWLRRKIPALRRERSREPAPMFR
jgi:TetR/AcrR family transcriptional repressor of bet genes